VLKNYLGFNDSVDAQVLGYFRRTQKLDGHSCSRPGLLVSVGANQKAKRGFQKMEKRKNWLATLPL
jgi:hypothetical protein